MRRKLTRTQPESVQICSAEQLRHPRDQRHLLVHCGGSSGSCSGQKISDHPADLPRWCCFLCRKGRDTTEDRNKSASQLTITQGVANKNQEASVAGAVAAAHYIRAVAPAYEIPVVLHTDHCAKKLLPWLDGMLDADEAYFKEHGEPLFSSHMIDLSEEEVDWNIETTAKYLKRAAPMKQWLEMVRRTPLVK